jgi:enolase
VADGLCGGRIIDIHAREILDSRGNPTVEVDVTLEDGTMGRAAVPSGASTGATRRWKSATATRARYMGKGVLEAVAAVNGETGRSLVGFDATEQEAIDAAMIELDGTENKGRLGANAILGVSPRRGQGRRRLHRPAALPLCRRHRGPCPAGADDEYRQRRRACRQPDRHPGIHDHAGGRRQHRRRRAHGLRGLPHAEEGAVGGGPFHRHRRRGRLRARISSTRDALDFILKSIEKAGYTPGDDVMLALDCAATEYFKDGKYVLAGEGKTLSAEENVAYLPRWCDDYPILSIEDGCRG